MLLNYLRHIIMTLIGRETGDTLYTRDTVSDATTMGITSCCECIARREYSMVWSGKYWTSPHDDGCAHARYKCTYIRIVYLDVSCIKPAHLRRIFFRDAIFRRETTHGWGYPRVGKCVCDFMFEKRENGRENTAYVISRVIVYYSAR